MPGIAIDLAGREFGRLTVLSRAGDYVAPSGHRKARWSCRCACGAKALVAGENLRGGRTQSCGCHMRESVSRSNEGRAKDRPGYFAAHEKVGRRRGPARSHPCVDCGGAASQWSYDHADPNELSEARDGRVLVYSTDPGHYAPRCSPCHKTFDLARSPR